MAPAVSNRPSSELAKALTVLDLGGKWHRAMRAELSDCIEELTGRTVIGFNE